MSKIDLKKVDDELMAQIIKKFNSVRTGGRFYQTCRTSGPLVEWAKPVWPLSASVCYTKGRRSLHNYDNIEAKDRAWSRLPLKFCRIASIGIGDESFHAKFLPEIKSIGAVDMLSISSLSTAPVEQVQKLLMIAKPKAVQVHEDYLEQHSDVFKDIKHLELSNVAWANDWKEKKNRPCFHPRRLFEIMKTRKSIYWSNGCYPNKTLRVFLKSWLEGADTGSMETVIYSFVKRYEFPYVKKIVNEKPIKKQAKSFVEQKDAIILERKAGGHLRVCANPNRYQIEFTIL